MWNERLNENRGHGAGEKIVTVGGHLKFEWDYRIRQAAVRIAFPLTSGRIKPQKRHDEYSQR